MIDINKVKIDIINYGAYKIYEYSVELVDEDEFMLDSQVAKIFNNQFDVLKINLYLNNAWVNSLAFVKVSASEQEIIYATGFGDGDKVLKLTINKDASEHFTYSIDETSGGGGGSLDYATNAEIDALFDDTPTPQMATITFDLANCHLEINGVEIGGGHQVPIGQPLEIAVVGDYLDCEWNCSVLTMNGVDIRNLFDADGNPTSITIPSVTGDIYMEIECTEAEEPVEGRIYFEDPATGEEITDLSMAQGETTNIYDYIQFENIITDVTLSCDNLLVINLTTAGVMEAVGSVGEGATITVTSVSDPNISAELYVEIVDEEPEDIPVESIEFINLPADDSIELNVGDVVDMSQYIKVNPADATDKSYTLTTDAPSVLSVNGTTITVLQGAEGLNANLTVTANDGSGCYNVMIVDILNGEEPEEPEVPIESIRYTDGSGNTCIGFGMLEGEHVDLWTNLEVTPSDATEGVEFISDDDGIVQVDGTGIATATGEVGDSTTITMTSMGNPNIFTTVEISIAEEEPEE